MRIGFDAKRIFYNKTGLGNYARSLVSQLTKTAQGSAIYLFSPKTSDLEYPEFSLAPYNVISGNGRILWRQLGIKKDIEYNGIDIYHGLSNELPWHVSRCKRVKFIVTIHDLIFLKYPQYYRFIDRTIYNRKFKSACQQADHIIAVSACTKDDIVEHYNIDPKKISVIYQACAEMYYSQDYPDHKRSDYGLFVSSITRRKNLQVVIEAVAIMQEKERIEIKIVGSGGSRYKDEMMQLAERLGVRKWFTLLTDISDKELISMYRRARFSIYPSYYEGYGIPVQESLLCGTPVITSNISALPEAGMGLAVLVNPLSSEQVKTAILKILTEGIVISREDVEKIKTLVNPRKQAEEVVNLYQSVLSD